MRALTDPSAISKLHSSRARIPPNDLVSPCTASSALIPGLLRRESRSSQVSCGENGVHCDLIMRSASGGRWPEAAQAAGQRWDDAVREEVDDEEEQDRVSDEVEVTCPEAVGKVLLGGADQSRADDRTPEGGPPAEEGNKNGHE